VEAIVSARLARATEEAVATFRRHASELEAVVMILGLAGDVDFLLHIAARDSAHLQKILHQLAAFAEGVQLRTSVLVDVERYPFPHYAVNRSAS
jgi:DNA-binding Lrp family transcriptional regulator